MANTSKTVAAFLVLIYITVCCSFGLYEDQAGLFDWKQDYVGKVKYFYWDHSPSQSGKKAFIASERNVIASLHAHDGTIAWRRIFEPTVRGRIDAFLYQGTNLVSIHAGGLFVRSWQTLSGSLLWEKSLSDDINSRASGFFVSKNNKGEQQLIVATSGTVYSLRMSDGMEEWKAEMPHSDTIVQWYVKERIDGSYIAVGITPGQRVTVVTITTDGGVSKTHTNVPARWISIDTSCIIMDDAKHFACYSPQSRSLQLLVLDNANVFKATEVSAFDVPTSPESQIEGLLPGMASSIIFRAAHDRLLFMALTPQETFFTHKTLEKTYTAEVVRYAEKYILLTLSQADPETLKLSATDQSDGTEITDLSHDIPFAHYHGPPTKIHPFLFSKKKDSSHRPGCKLIFLAQDFSIHFAQKSKLNDENKAHWRREEALAYILAVQMVDLPVSENQAKFEDEFGAKEEDIVAMFFKRLKAQFSQLKSFTHTLIERALGHHHHHAKSLEAIEEEEPQEEDLIRDDFNLHKIIIVATAAGKLYGIRSHTGKIAWQQFIPELTPFNRYGDQKLVLIVQRSTAHFPHEPQCTVLGVNQKTGNGLLVSFNPVTGALTMGKQGHSYDTGFKVLQAEMITDLDSEFLRGIILIDDKIQAHVYPASSESALRESHMQYFFHLINPETGIMTGYRLIPGQQSKLALEEVWNLDLQKSQQTITGVYGKRAVEHVHSQGRVLGDRSVLYKYLNPNLVAIVAEGEEQQQSSVSKGSPTPFFSVYLVDGVTGHMVYHQTHKRSRGPVKVVHSENWIVYFYYNEKHRRHEMGVLELYEGKEQSNSTAFSSFSPPPPPLVLRQSYIFREPLYAMEATVTEKGIASKNIIIALKIGGILSLPKALLDPRRPVIPTQETMEEGTIPYVPEIPLSAEAFVNYNRSVFNVNGVFTSPAGLESTSLVFVYGIDIFYTRVMPSRMFDVLKEDFDYLFIGGVLGLMILFSFITQKFAAKKALKRAWK
ncbi:unnamed protein product [Lymnaea stagnalis]|uniref:ER membrane protein complex subunit 1 n=1 Tax=Lymnaea stagnalis TaxID=6523 RepID=A0AAV2IAX0_LYMST